MSTIKNLIDKLAREHVLTKEEFVKVLTEKSKDDEDYLRELASQKRNQYFGNKVYTRGLIEFTNYCKNDCYYCGIRKSNLKVSRYRLSLEDILECCKIGYEIGFRTFVLQGGEDMRFTDEDMVTIIKHIKAAYPDCAITLSLGERSYESYKKMKEAGADRYLLRHETASESHYKKLHPESMSLRNRKNCLYDLKKLGFQVGAGFMVGSPYQRMEDIAEDLIFLHDLSPEMVGVGPFLPHSETPFKEFDKGSYELTLCLISMVRLMLPNGLIPATTALGTINPLGRESGILHGANVVMPNLSPVGVRKQYELYDNKICTGDEAAECKMCLNNRMKKIGYEIVSERGDFVPLSNE